MTGRPPSRLGERLTGLLKDLTVLAQTLPVWEQQARLEDPPVGRLPTAPAGADLSDVPGPSYGDPTGEEVVRRPGADEEMAAADPAIWARVSRDVAALTGSVRAALAQTPAVTAAVRTGRTSPRDGRRAAEVEQERFVHALEPHRCVCAEGHTDEDNVFGPGQLRRGLCPTHLAQWYGWCDSRGVAADADMLVRWRASLGAPESEGPYRSNMREVA